MLSHFSPSKRLSGGISAERSLISMRTYVVRGLQGQRDGMAKQQRRECITNGPFITGSPCGAHMVGTRAENDRIVRTQFVSN